MPSLPNPTVLGILILSKRQDAEELSKCNRSIRKMYEINRRLCVYRLDLKQPILYEDKYVLTIRRCFVQSPEYFLLNMEEVKIELLKFRPNSVKFEISDLAATQLLGFLPEEWFNSVKYIDIRCLETKNAKTETISATKTAIKKFIRGFGTLDNIMFKPNEITTTSREYWQCLCLWIRCQKIQTRGFRVKYEKLWMRGTDVEEILKTSRLSKYFHLWMDYIVSEGELGTEIRRFLRTIPEVNAPGRFTLNNTRILVMLQNAEADFFAKSLLAIWLLHFCIAVKRMSTEGDNFMFRFFSCVIALLYALVSFLITKF